jgi:predicted transposase/invertase (TIGR01784 family)
MQKAKVNFFKDRALFYTTFPIKAQAEKGDWNFELQAIYFVAILDFFYDENEEKAKFMRNVTLKDQDGEVFYDKLHFKFLQMPAFKLKEHELKTQFDKWAYFLKNLENFDNIPQIFNEPIFKKAFNTAQLAKFNPKQRTQYEQSRLHYLGLRAVSTTAYGEGKTEGIEIGKTQREIEIVKKAIAEGFDNETIAKLTGLDIKTIENIRQST